MLKKNSRAFYIFCFVSPLHPTLNDAAKIYLTALKFLYHIRNYITTTFALTKCWSILKMHLGNIKFKIIVESDMGKLSRCHFTTKT